jgi:hypothetical protein
MENNGGRTLVEERGDLCERKNGNGVDPNRNWNIDWGKKEADYRAQEEAPGSHPFSEPETEIVRDVATSFKPHVWVAVHSGALQDSECWPLALVGEHVDAVIRNIRAREISVVP